MQVLNREFLEEKKEELINFPDWIPNVIWRDTFSYEDWDKREEIMDNNEFIFKREMEHSKITKYQNQETEYDPGMLDLYMFTLAHPEFAPAINKTDKEKAIYRKFGLKLYKDLI